MKIVIAGAHGQIGRRLTRLLAARGDAVRGLIRNPAHAADVKTDGGEPSLCDLEAATLTDVALAVEGADAVVFAAGAGPGSGPERKLTVDRDGAILLLEGATAASVPGFVVVSAIGVEDRPTGDDVMSVYARAKADADRAVMESDRQWTIVRPGRLTDEPGDGQVRIATRLPSGDVSRDNVAAVLAAVLHDSRTTGRVLTVLDGNEPIDAALDAALTADPRGEG